MSDVEIPTVDVEHTSHTTDSLLLDVREVAEWIHGHIPGTVNVPLGELAAHVTQLDRDRPIIVICRSGNRSGIATQLLRSIGFDAYNMRGGSLAWASAGKPLFTSGGDPGIVA